VAIIGKIFIKFVRNAEKNITKPKIFFMKCKICDILNRLYTLLTFIALHTKVVKKLFSQKLLVQSKRYCGHFFLNRPIMGSKTVIREMVWTISAFLIMN